jgi:hypothetical protein
MMRSIYLFLLPALSLGTLDIAVARPATTAAHDWCEVGLDSARGLTPLDPPLEIVRLGGLAEAMRLLKNRTILPITSRTAKRLAGSVLPGPGKLYLVRSGIFAQPGTSPAQYLLRARNAPFRETLWDSEKGMLVIYTMQMQEAREDKFPAPLIMRLRVSPVGARSFCEFHY